MEYIEITDSDSEAVKQFHDVLVEAFPDPSEREDVEALRENLREGSWINEDAVCRYHLIVARQDDEVVGGTSFHFFSRDQIALGMGSYLAVKEGFRGKGIGTELVGLRDQTLFRDAKELGCYLKGLIIQVNDPELMSAEEMGRDAMDSWERERFWRRRGYRKIAFDFIQPPIRGGELPIEYLSLYMFPYCLEWKRMERIPSTELQNVVDCFICTGASGLSETGPSHRQMKSDLATQDYFQIL